MPNLWLGRHYDSVHHGLGRNWLDDERPAATSSGRWKTTEALLCGPMFLSFGRACCGETSWLFAVAKHGTVETNFQRRFAPLVAASRRRNFDADARRAPEHGAAALGYRDRLASRGVPHAPRGASVRGTCPVE